MIKFTTFSTHDNEGHSLVHVIHGDVLEKSASYKKDVEDFVHTFEKKAEHTYLLVNAMTSGDYYGENLNGDYFPDEQLKQYHKTFEKNAHFYRHHKNKNPEESMGKVVYASHNPDMHRVELVIEVENSKAPDIMEKLAKNENIAVSMGVRTPSDRCSICNNRAKNTAEYCDHLKYEMRRVMPDGRKVAALNDDRLTFFDISAVRIPADRTAGVISKVAAAGVQTIEHHVIPSALIGEEWLKCNGLKESALTKEVPGTIEGMSQDPHNLILDSQKRIPVPVLDKLAEEHSLGDILSTFLGLRICPRPEEFQRLVLLKMNRKPLADQVLEKGIILMDMDEQPQIPVDITVDGFNHEVAAKLMDLLPDLALTKPLIIRRVLIKRAEIEEKREGLISKMTSMLPTVGAPQGPRPSTYAPGKNPLFPLIGLGGLFAGFAKAMTAVGTDLTKFDKLDAMLIKNPYLIPLFVGAVALGTEGAQHMLFREKHAAKIPAIAKSIAIGVPASYLYAGSQENKLQKGQPISKFQDLVRKHPFLSGMAGIGAFHYEWPRIKSYLSKMGSLDRVVYGLGPEKFDELYNDVVGITNP